MTNEDTAPGQYKAQEGTWTLQAPDGRQWTADSPLKVVAIESNERIPAKVRLARMTAGLMEEPAPSAQAAEPVSGETPICSCETCTIERDESRAPLEREYGRRMIVCAICGTKRCPHATNHRLKCWSVELSAMRERAEKAEYKYKYEHRAPTQWAYDQACKALNTMRERAEKAEEEAKKWKDLKELAGHWQDGSSTVVKLFDDDATRSCFIKVGDKTYGTDGSSYDSALAEAVKHKL